MKFLHSVTFSTFSRLANLALVLSSNRPASTSLCTSADESLLIRHATRQASINNNIFICQLRRLVNTHRMNKDLPNLVSVSEVFLVASLPVPSIENFVRDMVQLVESRRVLLFVNDLLAST